MNRTTNPDVLRTIAKEAIVAFNAEMLWVIFIKKGYEPFLGGALDHLRTGDFYENRKSLVVMRFVWNFIGPYLRDPRDHVTMVTAAFLSRNPAQFKEALRKLDPRWFTHPSFRQVVNEAVKAYHPDDNKEYVDALRVHGVVATLMELMFTRTYRFDHFVKLVALMDGPLNEYMALAPPQKRRWYIDDLLLKLKEFTPDLLRAWWTLHGREVSRRLFDPVDVAFITEAFPDARFIPEDQDIVEAAGRGDADVVASLLPIYQTHKGLLLRAAVIAAARGGHVGVLRHLGEHTPMVLALVHQESSSVLRHWHADTLRFVLATYGPDSFLRPDVRYVRLSRQTLIHELASIALWSDGDIRKAELFLEAYGAGAFFPAPWTEDPEACLSNMPSALPPGPVGVVMDVMVWAQLVWLVDG